jgi:hypothetical protein
MRLVKPYQGGAGIAAAGAPRRVRKRPEWLKEYIDNLGIYVLLSCGHKIDMNSRGLLIVDGMRGTTVGCYHCGEFSTVIKKISFVVYADIPAKPDSNVPLF